MRFELHEDYFILDGSDAVLFDTLEVQNNVPRYDNHMTQIRNFTGFLDISIRVKLLASAYCLRRIWFPKTPKAAPAQP